MQKPAYSSSMGSPPALTVLVPRRAATFVVLFVGGMAVIALLGCLYLLGLRLGPRTSDGMVAAFDLDGEGSIASWFSVVLLFLCGQASVLTVLLVAAGGAGAASDGRPAAWGAVAALWFIMSLDEGASLHEGFKEMMARFCGTRLMGDGSIYWVVPYFVLLAAAGLFLLWSMRRNGPALLCLVGWAGSHAVAVASQLEWILRGRWPAQILVEESAEMLGYLFILLALGLHARRLVLRLERADQGGGGQSAEPAASYRDSGRHLHVAPRGSRQMVPSLEWRP